MRYLNEPVLSVTTVGWLVAVVDDIKHPVILSFLYPLDRSFGSTGSQELVTGIDVLVLHVLQE